MQNLPGKDDTEWKERLLPQALQKPKGITFAGENELFSPAETEITILMNRHRVDQFPHSVTLTMLENKVLGLVVTWMVERDGVGVLGGFFFGGGGAKIEGDYRSSHIPENGIAVNRMCLY